MVLPLYLQKRLELKEKAVETIKAAEAEKEIVVKVEKEKEIVVKKKVVKKIKEEEDSDSEEPTKIFKNLSRFLIKK